MLHLSKIFNLVLLEFSRREREIEGILKIKVNDRPKRNIAYKFLFIAF